MKLPLFIAGRYLFAKKSHNVINIISAISAIGMAIGTAALIVILSVYNGFDKLIKESIDSSTPDLLVLPSSGKTMPGQDPDSFTGIKGVAEAKVYLEDNVFFSYDGAEGIAKARGVDDLSLYHGEIPLCAVSSSLSQTYGINPNFLSPLSLYYPSRTRKFSAGNPMAMLESVKVRPKRLIYSNSENTSNLILIPMDLMRQLLGYENDVTAVEIWLEPDCPKHTVKEAISEIHRLTGSTDVKVLDRYAQNEALYKVIKYEKAAIFFILLFVVVIIAFNIFGSLTMLIIEKKEDIWTLRSLGAEKKTIKSIFVLEGWLISLLGLGVGLIIGTALALLQQKTGIISMPGNYLVNAYPVIIKWTDIALTSIGVASVGYIVATLPARTSDPMQEEQ